MAVPEASSGLESGARQGSVRAARELARALVGHDDRRFRHVTGAARAAAHIANAVPGLDRPTLVAAAWLHDIGYSPSLTVTGFHPVDGALHLAEGGWDPGIVALVAHHSHSRVTAGYFRADAQLRAFALPPQPLADALAFCDLVSGVDGSGVTVGERLAELRSRRGPTPVPPLVREERYRMLAASAARVRRAIEAAQPGTGG
jgi:hypothetical protein